MRRKGASGESFEAIVAAGPRSALPHARPTARQIGKNELVVTGPGCYTAPLLQRPDAHGARRQGVQSSPRLVPRSSGRADGGKGRAEVGSNLWGHDAAGRNVLHRKGLGRYFAIARVMGLALKIHEGPESLGTKKRFWRRETS